VVIEPGRSAVEFSQSQPFSSFCFDLPQSLTKKIFPKTIDKSAQVCYNKDTERRGKNESFYN